MSIEFDQFKDVIDNLDFELNGSLWTIDGVVDIQGIKEESVVEFESAYTPVVELSVRTADFPTTATQGTTVVSQQTGDEYIINRVLPEINGQVAVWMVISGG